MAVYDYGRHPTSVLLHRWSEYTLPHPRSNHATILLIVSSSPPHCVNRQTCSAVILHLFVTTYNQPNPTIDRVNSKLNS